MDEQLREMARPPWRGSRLRLDAIDQFWSLIAAVQFLTRLPTPRLVLHGEADRHRILGQSAAYFPIVGAGIGAVTGLTILLTARVWPIAIAVLIGLVVEALLTGAFHEDAVADFCDAFGGGWTREDVLRILKDSRVGSYGVLGLGLAVALRAASLGAIEPGRLLAAIVASASLGRWVVLPAMWALPPVSDRASLSRDVGQQIPASRLVLGTAMAVPGCVGMALTSPWPLAAAVVGILLLATWLVRYVGRRVGGINGDSLGFLCYASQVIVLLAAAANTPVLGSVG
jgi:adenosylcobinamide-GDP ribazoletransferase